MRDEKKLGNPLPYNPYEWRISWTSQCIKKSYSANWLSRNQASCLAKAVGERISL